MATVGGGYLWSSVTLHSDREHTALMARPTHPNGSSAFRFTPDQVIVVPTRQFISAPDEFVAQTPGKLRANGVAPMSFDATWHDVLAERAQPGGWMTLMTPIPGRRP